METKQFLSMLGNDFGYQIDPQVAKGRDIYLEGQWVGYLAFDDINNPKGFLISECFGQHLKTLCMLHDQKVIQ